VIDAIPDDFEGRDELVESLVAPTLLDRGARLEDVGNVAAFAASDLARTITASAINITCGAIIT
jgi:3-oxoacyl-[acyl-carrier protein] reductase